MADGTTEDLPRLQFPQLPISLLLHLQHLGKGRERIRDRRGPLNQDRLQRKSDRMKKVERNRPIRKRIVKKPRVSRLRGMREMIGKLAEASSWAASELERAVLRCVQKARLRAKQS